MLQSSVKPTMSYITCVLLLVFLNTAKVISSSVSDAFEDDKSITMAIPKPPEKLAQVKYAKVEINLGNWVTSDQVSVPPSVTYDNSPDELYTMILLEPDSISAKHPIFSTVQFWIVGNIPGDKVNEGQTLSEYYKPGPDPFTGSHHFVFLVYKQCGHIEFHEPYLVSTDAISRLSFSPTDFAKKYDLGDPIAGNFFQLDSFGPQLI